MKGSTVGNRRPPGRKAGSMSESETRHVLAEQSEEPPPFLGSWRRVYLAVIAWLLFLIAIFYLFARGFAA
jgi:hypothetical protein